MKKLLISISILLLVVTGCSSSFIPEKATPEKVTNQPLPTRYISTDTAVVATLSLTPLPQQPNSSILAPEVVDICPSNPEVPISDLGMPYNLSILTVSEDEELRGGFRILSTDVLSYSGTSNIPDKLTEINKLSKDGIIDLIISPSGLWMIILRWNNDTEQKTLWASTVDGKKQWKLIDLMRYQDVYWINDNEILITGSPYENDYEGGVSFEDKMPLFRINPFTLETRYLTPLPQHTTYDYGSYTVINEHPYALYMDNVSSKIYLYDYDLATSTRAFQWIDFSNSTAGAGVKEDGLYYIVLDNGGVEFSTNLTVELITENYNYDDVMKQIDINGKKLTSDLFMPRGKYFYISLPDEPNKLAPFYLYDYKANILKDYCLLMGVSSVTISPNDDFALFTIEGDEQSGEQVLLLNLETGYYSLIPRSQDIGFWKRE